MVKIFLILPFMR